MLKMYTWNLEFRSFLPQGTQSSNKRNIDWQFLANFLDSWAVDFSISGKQIETRNYSTNHVKMHQVYKQLPQSMFLYKVKSFNCLALYTSSSLRHAFTQEPELLGTRSLWCLQHYTRKSRYFWFSIKLFSWPF